MSDDAGDWGSGRARAGVCVWVYELGDLADFAISVSQKTQVLLRAPLAALAGKLARSASRQRGFGRRSRSRSRNRNRRRRRRAGARQAAAHAATASCRPVRPAAFKVRGARLRLQRQARVRARSARARHGIAAHEKRAARRSRSPLGAARRPSRSSATARSARLWAVWCNSCQLCGATAAEAAAAARAPGGGRAAAPWPHDTRWARRQRVAGGALADGRGATVGPDRGCGAAAGQHFV